MTRKPMLAIGVAAIAFAATAAQAQNNPPASQTPAQTSPAPTPASPAPAKVSRADKAFMREAVQADLAEVKTGQFAQQKGQTEAIKQFGQKMVSDHSANADEARQVAQSIGVTPPVGPSAKDNAGYKKMSRLSGARFDRVYARDMVKDHKADIAKFKREAAKSGPVADFAKKTLPTLEQHLQMAESLEHNKRQTTGSK